VQGYEYAKGQYVVMTDEDFEKARVRATQTFDIRAFVPAAEIADLYFDEPNSKAGVRAYALLRDALKNTGRIGVGTVVLRQREDVASVEPSGDTLVLSRMRFAHEIRSPNNFDLSKAGEGWTKRITFLASSSSAMQAVLGCLAEANRTAPRLPEAVGARPTGGQ
jgi:DNA end-binding protein Ku